MIGRWKVLAPHAKLEVSLSGSACSHSLYLPHALSPYAVPAACDFFPHYPINIYRGYGGRAPMFTNSP